MPTKQVLIAGGTGFIGSALKNLFQQNGIKTLIISRMPAPDSITWDELESNGLPASVDAVINVAGQNVLDPLRRWTPGFRQNVISSRVETNQRLAEAIRCNASQVAPTPRVFISISGVGFYPPSDPESSEAHDEESHGGEHDFLARLCREWEAANHVGGGTRSVVVRSGIVLGRQGGIVQNMYPLFYCGLGGRIGSGTQWMPWIHLDDLCHIFFRSVQNDAFTGVVNAVAPEPITNDQFTKSLARVMWRPALLSVPEQVIEWTFGPERAVMMTKGQLVRSKRMEELGHRFVYPTINSALRNIASSASNK